MFSKKEKNKPGPKPKEEYGCACYEPQRTFVSSKKKGDHERNSRKKARTEVGSIAGSDRLEERMEEFDYPAKQSAFKSVAGKKFNPVQV
jgi:hypothetical protein